MILVDMAATHGQAHVRMQKALVSCAVISYRRRGERGKVELQGAAHRGPVERMSNEYAFTTLYAVKPLNANCKVTLETRA